MLRLRQIAGVAADRDAITGQLHDVFGVEVAYHDPEIERIDLINSLVPFGDQFFEVISPTAEGTTADRYRRRRGGDSSYMMIFQVDDHSRHKVAVAEHGVRIVANFSAEGFENMQLHPADTGGAFFEIDQQDGADRWNPAGPDWHGAVNTELVTGFSHITVRCTDPAAVATRWGALLLRDPTPDGDAWTIATDDATVRFEPPGPDGVDGITEIGVATVDAAEVLRRADATGVPHDDAGVTICGVYFRVA